MKTCPQCGKTYPDSEGFCDTDGAQLSAGQAGTPRGTDRPAAASSGAIECPVCGGKAEPGETICNFCGARLSDSAAGTRVVEAPPHLDTAQRQFEGEPPPEERASTHRLLGTIGYAIAGLVALAAGAWLAHYISTRPQPAQVAKESPSEAATPAAPPAAVGPLAVLANNIGLQVTGESASAPERDQTAARKLFDDNQAALLDLYKRTLSTDPSIKDGMIVRLRVAPDGGVTQGEVRVSTSSNPGLDADVVKAMMGWRLGAFGGSAVEADYPVVLAHDSAEQAQIESALSDKLAHLSPAEPSEYTSVPAPATLPAVAAVSTPASAGSPATVAPPPPAVGVAPPPPAVAAAAPTKRARPRHRATAIATPKPTLLKLVHSRLAANRKFSRVKAYTSSGTVTLFGKVFNDDDKLAAERAVRGIDGVANVVDTLTTVTAEWADNENRIRQEFQNAGLAKVTVKVIGRDAFLDGEVSTDLEKQRAVTIAEGTAPVVVRTNLIRVVPRGFF